MRRKKGKCKMKAFTVRELIEELECYDENRLVWIAMDNMEAPIRNVYLDEEEEKLVVK